MSLITPQSDQQGDSSAGMARPFHIAPGQATAYADARAIRRAVLARLTTFECALLWRWCIGVTVAYAGLFALLAILVLATHASLYFYSQVATAVWRVIFLSLKNVGFGS
jgi:hypothetical protein